MKDINEVLEELEKSEGDIICNPSAIDRLKKQGVSFDESPMLTAEEAISKLFEERKEAAMKLIEKLPDSPNIASPAIKSLYNEIGQCILFGLNGAAITLSGILVEFILKFAAYKVEMGGFAKYDSKLWDEFEKLDFGKAIWRANKARLLTKEERKKLEQFKNQYRNPYNHYNIKRITEEYFGMVKRLNLETLEVEEFVVHAKDNPVIQAQVKPLADAESVFAVFAFADSAVKLMFEKIGYLLQNTQDEEVRSSESQT